MSENILWRGIDTTTVSRVIPQREGGDRVRKPLGNCDEGTKVFGLPRDCWVGPVCLVPVARDILVVQC